jgi:hypothetical protein
MVNLGNKLHCWARSLERAPAPYHGKKGEVVKHVRNLDGGDFGFRGEVSSVVFWGEHAGMRVMVSIPASAIQASLLDSRDPNAMEAVVRQHFPEILARADMMLQAGRGAQINFAGRPGLALRFTPEDLATLGRSGRRFPFASAAHPELISAD